jgi:hypothetical protein
MHKNYAYELFFTLTPLILLQKKKKENQINALDEG